MALLGRRTVKTEWLFKPPQLQSSEDQKYSA